MTCEDMISSHVKISMISVTSGLSLKLYLNSLVYHRNIFGSSSKVLGNLRTSSDIFGNFRKFSENVRERSSGLWDNRPRSIYQYSNMGPRLSGLTSIFGVVFFVSKSPVGIERQKKLEKFAILTRKPRSHA